jgi:molybdenum cofactor cytidylyltransferase
MTAPRVTGVVLAAGVSRRLGQPKQLLRYRDSTLLGETLVVARQCGFDQTIVTLGGAADQILAAVDLHGVQTVTVDEPATGCSASLRAAVAQVDPASDGIVLLLGDQPGIAVSAVRQLLGSGSDHPIAVCRYADGIGHPFWFSREVFGDIVPLHGDKAVWKLIESGRFPVTEVDVDGLVPHDVDTWDDYEKLLAMAVP